MFRIASDEALYFMYLQELLYLYGFVVDNNPDDYLMVTLIMMYVLKDNNFDMVTIYLLCPIKKG